MDGNYSLADIAAATGDNDGMFGGGGGGLGLLALIFLFSLVFGFGGGGYGGQRPDVVTESALCNSTNFNNLENSVGRLGNAVEQKADTLGQAVYNLGYNQLAQTDQLAQQIAAENTNTRVQLADCCCNTQRAIDGVNLGIANATASVNAATSSGIQKVLDAISANKVEELQGQVQQLQLNQALCGVVRYPTATTYCGGVNPFYSGCACGSI